jgi:rhodanese-related sulfurtransferase
MQQFGQFVVNHWDLFLALALLTAMMFGGGLNSRLRGFTNVDPVSAVQLINREEAVILDVRENSEVKDGLILGAIHIPLGGLKSRLAELDEFKTKPVIVGCRSGHRSATACGQLKKEGFETVYNLKGGVLAWKNAGMPLQKEIKSKKKKRK